MELVTIMHWLAALALAGMALFASIESQSSSLIPKSLFLWPAMGFIFGLLTLVGVFLMGAHGQQSSYLILGIVFVFGSLQALLVNIRQLSRWPSGAVWIGLVLVALMMQLPAENAASLFERFISKFIGLMWGAIGIAKITSERTVSGEGRIPMWIYLSYGQAILIAALA